jgi:potassium channel subfamily T protein 1
LKELLYLRIQDAIAVFIMTTKGSTDKDLGDQHTILRSWAIKDYAPHVPQYVQLFRTDNKMHLSFVGLLNN